MNSNQDLVRLPSRWEDLDVSFRGRLRPNRKLIDIVLKAFKSMQISGGIRFLPIFGNSGCGKTCAAQELSTHLPDTAIELLKRSAVESYETLQEDYHHMVWQHGRKKMLIAVIDQYEEVAAQRQAIPTSFVESLSLFDRARNRSKPIIYLWLTTSRSFRDELVKATSRNARILLDPDFVLEGPPREEWPEIIEETFKFHNNDRVLADYEIINEDLQELATDPNITIGTSIERVSSKLEKHVSSLHDMSNYQVIMLWPVTGSRLARIQQFTDARQGYKLDWTTFYRQLNQDNQQQLPLRQYNRTRLYFDFRIVPIGISDIYDLCQDIDNEEYTLAKSYLNRFSNTHLVDILKNEWNPMTYAPLRDRNSKRSEMVKTWYNSVTSQPTKIGKRLALALSKIGFDAEYEKTINSTN